jgi:hypothetical protein
MVTEIIRLLRAGLAEREQPADAAFAVIVTISVFTLTWAASLALAGLIRG